MVFIAPDAGLPWFTHGFSARPPEPSPTPPRSQHRVPSISPPPSESSPQLWAPSNRRLHGSDSTHLRGHLDIHLSLGKPSQLGIIVRKIPPQSKRLAPQSWPKSYIYSRLRIKSKCLIAGLELLYKPENIQIGHPKDPSFAALRVHWARTVTFSVCQGPAVCPQKNDSGRLTTPTWRLVGMPQSRV